jgi:sporulation protein YlmC with PRC-barrel domain
MKTTLMTATAVAALLAASSAFGQQYQEPTPAQDPLAPAPPAATETLPAPDAATLPDAATPPDAMTSEPIAPDTGAEAETIETPDQAAAPSDSERFIAQQEPADILASSLIGSSVENAAGESLGSINDLVFAEEGSVDAIVIGVGGFLGIGEKNVAVAFSEIEKTTDADGNVKFVLNATAEELEAAPPYVTVAELQQQKAMEQVPSADPAAPAADPMAPAPVPSQ